MKELLKELNSTDEVDRIYAAQDIAETDDPKLAAPLLERLKSESSQAVRDAIIFALGNLPCTEVYDMLLELFRFPDAYLRNAVIGIFGSEKEKAVPFLMSHLNHADREVRKLILDALFATQVSQAIPGIRMGLEDASVNVRITSVEYIGRLEDKESADRIVSLLRTESEPMLKMAALETLCLIGNPGRIKDFISDFSDVDPLYLPQIIKLSAKTGVPDVICKILGKISHPRLYEEDIIYSLEQAAQSFPGFCKDERVSEYIKKILKETKNDEIAILCRNLLGKQ